MSFSETKALIGGAGFGGPEIALREAGIVPTGIEMDNAIAEVNRVNGGHCLVANILTIDPADYIGWLIFHFSPPCPSFSVASHQGSETETDLALARKICDFIRVGQPVYFTLENVWGYRKSLSWHLIQYTLLEEGYGLDAWHLNAADYGVPQSRRRMIVIARRDGRQPAKPWPTHSKRGDMFTKPWQGWYETIEDLIPGLPETKPAPWQQDRMPDEMRDYLIMTGNTSRDGIGNKPGRGCLAKSQPANTVSVGPHGGAMPRAFLIPGDNTSNGVIRYKDEPMVTVQTRTPERCTHRAFIIGQGSRSSLKLGDEPMDTVTANNNQTGVKAFVVDSANSGHNTVTARDGDKPIFTVTTNEKTANPKAFIIGGQYQTPNNSQCRIVQNRSADQPVWTVCASDKLDTRIWQQGRWVSMSPRCLARFQDFPDSFILPGEPGLDENTVLILDPRTDRELACRGIGNALPAGVYRAILRSLDL